MQDAWRAYLELALGATETSRKKAQKVARRLVGKSGATAAQLTAIAEEMVTTSAANREALVKLIRFEIDKALGRVGLATADEVAELNARVRNLEVELRAERARAEAAEAAATAPAATAPAATALAETAPAETVPAETVPAETVPAATPPAKRTPAKKAAAVPAKATKKAVAKKTATKKSATPSAASIAEDLDRAEPVATPAPEPTPAKKTAPRKTAKKAPAKKAGGAS
jgi:polyhydroxyalkanoate synthesis regulator phasin